LQPEHAQYREPADSGYKRCRGHNVEDGFQASTTSRERQESGTFIFSLPKTNGVVTWVLSKFILMRSSYNMKSVTLKAITATANTLTFDSANLHTFEGKGHNSSHLKAFTEV
jgi:hypothetical protein